MCGFGWIGVLVDWVDWVVSRFVGYDVWVLLI